MPSFSSRSPLVLSRSDRDRLEKLSKSRTCLVREGSRATMLLLYAGGISFTEIQRRTGHSRSTIYKCVDRALSGGVDAGLKDAPRRRAVPQISCEARAWVVSVACTQPKNLGAAAELWTVSALTSYINSRATDAGHARLETASRATIHRIVKSADLSPHQVRYCLERRDPDFDEKMGRVLAVYRGVFADRGKPAIDGVRVHSVSVDEKPGVQAIANTAPDRPPRPGKRRALHRDYEYRRLGTLSIIAALDLHTGEIIANVERRHRSREFIKLLKKLDRHYPPGDIVRIVLDNHSAHISKETRAYLAARPNRFIYVHTPKHGSWLNLIETSFSRMARSFLRHIRVASLEELKERIELGIKEMNETLHVTRWRRFDLLEPSQCSNFCS